MSGSRTRFSKCSVSGSTYFVDVESIQVEKKRIIVWYVCKILQRFSITFTANGKRQAEISRLPKTREIYLVSVYILPVSHSYGASTKNREISKNNIIFFLLRQAAACRLPFGVGRKREAKSL